MKMQFVGLYALLLANTALAQENQETTKDNHSTETATTLAETPKAPVTEEKSAPLEDQVATVTSEETAKSEEKSEEKPATSKDEKTQSEENTRDKGNNKSNDEGNDGASDATSSEEQAATPETDENTKPENWEKDSEAVYDLLVAKFKGKSDDYDGSVDTLVKFAKKQQDYSLYSEAIGGLFYLERYEEALELIKEWQAWQETQEDISKSKKDITKFLEVAALVLNKQIDLAIETTQKYIEEVLADATDKDTTLFSQVIMYGQIPQFYWTKPIVKDYALRLYEKYPENDNVLGLIIAQIYGAHGDTDKAIEVINKLRFKNPRNLTYIKVLDVVYRQDIRFEAAEAMWQGVMNDYPNDPEFRLAYAEHLYSVYDFDNAIKEAEKVKSKEYIDDAQMLIANALVLQGQFDKAIKHFNAHFKDSENNDFRRYALTEQLLVMKAYEFAKQFAEPLLDFDKLTQSGDSLDEVVSTELSKVLMFRIAEAYYAESIETGDAWMKKVTDYDGTITEQTLAIELGNTLEKIGKYQVAYDRLSAYLEETPNDEMVRYTRGLIAARMKLFSAAINDFRIIYNTEPNNYNYQNGLGYTMLESGDKAHFEEGAELVKKAIFKGVSSPSIADSMGWYYILMDEPEKSLPYFRYAYVDMMTSGELNAHYITALYKSGKIRSAKKLYALASQYAPSKKELEDYLDDEIASQLTQ